jgi:hypothetical protein
VWAEHNGASHSNISRHCRLPGELLRAEHSTDHPPSAADDRQNFRGDGVQQGRLPAKR